MRAAISALPLFALVVTTRTAAADGDPIAVVSNDAAFRTAIADALAPAGMTILPVDNVEPPPIVELANASRVIADRMRATATVWLLFSPDKTTLVAYDRDVDRVLVRELPFTSPLDETQAAQAGRMVRTMLRALRVTPDTDQLPPRAAEAPGVREQLRALIVKAAPPVAPSPGMLGLELDGGVRARGPGDSVSVSGALAIGWRPDALGLQLVVRVAPASDIERGELSASISDMSIALLVRQPLRISPRLTVIAAGGPALHRVALDGTVAEMPVGDRAADPALRLGVAAVTPLGRGVGLGVAMWSDWLLQRQVYVVGDDSVLTVPLVQVMAGVIVTARIL